MSRAELVRTVVEGLPVRSASVSSPDHPLLLRGPDILALIDGELTAYFVIGRRTRQIASRVVLSRFAFPTGTSFVAVLDQAVTFDGEYAALFEEVVEISNARTMSFPAVGMHTVKYGPNQGQRDRSVGSLVPTVPSAWLDTGIRPIVAIKFASSRIIEATYDHRWVRQRRIGRQAWEWTTTRELRVSDRIPVPLTADVFGDEGDAWDGYFVGAMLGDGGMTALTPEFHCDPHDGAAAFMRDYANKHGCDIRENANRTIVRMRFPFKQWKRNPLAEILRAYGVWGKRCEVKALPGRNRATALVRLASLLDLRIGYKAAKLARLAERLAHVAPAASEMHGYDKAVALDRIVAIEDAAERATYCVTVDASNLFIVNGVVTGNCPSRWPWNEGAAGVQ